MNIVLVIVMMKLCLWMEKEKSGDEPVDVDKGEEGEAQCHKVSSSQVQMRRIPVFLRIIKSGCYNFPGGRISGFSDIIKIEE